MATTAEKTNGLPATHRTTYPTFNSDFLFGEDILAPFNALRRAMLAPLTASWVLPELPVASMPALNLYEKDGGYVVALAVPGYTKNDLTIEVFGHVLTVTGKVESEKHNGKQYHYHEIRSGAFTRTVTLPLEVNPEQVTASVENSILKIALQPNKSIQRTTIPIKG